MCIFSDVRLPAIPTEIFGKETVTDILEIIEKPFMFQGAVLQEP